MVQKAVSVSRKKSFWQKCWDAKVLILMMLPGLAYYLLFHYAPMYGVQLAFKKFTYRRGISGSDWIGWTNFQALFKNK